MCRICFWQHASWFFSWQFKIRNHHIKTQIICCWQYAINCFPLITRSQHHSTKNCWHNIIWMSFHLNSNICNFINIQFIFCKSIRNQYSRNNRTRTTSQSSRKRNAILRNIHSAIRNITTQIFFCMINRFINKIIFYRYWKWLSIFKKFCFFTLFNFQFQRIIQCHTQAIIPNSDICWCSWHFYLKFQTHFSPFLFFFFIIIKNIQSQNNLLQSLKNPISPNIKLNAQIQIICPIYLI